MQQSLSRPLSKTVATYRAIALLALNSLLAFVVFNLVAAVILGWLPAPELQGAMNYGLDELSRVYPNRSRDEIRELLSETWSRTYVYEPYTQFKEARFAGRFVNVNDQGFRETGLNQPWPPTGERPVVFVFGGSTTFGYGVADDETIPAQLQTALASQCTSGVGVYNLARSNYFSSQESLLFQRLLARGIRPTLAVFIDGLNEFGYAADEPKFTKRLTYLMEETPAQMGRRFVVNLPLARLAKHWIRRLDRAQAASVEAQYAEPIVARWLVNREQIRAVASRLGVETLFVWQPIPGYGYDLAFHLFAEEGTGGADASEHGFGAMDKLRKDPSGPLGEDFLWLAGLQDGRDEALYVDKVHYTAAFSREIAEKLAAAIGPRLCPQVEVAAEAWSPRLD